MLDNDTLKKLFKAGAILLVLDAPQNQLEFGIDVNCWNTGPRFKGIKIIPPGPHFVYYSLHNTKRAKTGADDIVNGDGTIEVTEGGTTGGDVRVGFWHMFESGEVVVMKWNAYNEEMELEKDKEQVARYKAGIQEFEPFLGAYPLLPPESTYPAWVKLSDHIKNTNIKSIFKDGFVSSYDDLLEEELSRASKIIDRQQKQEAEGTASNKTSQSVSRKTETIFEEDEVEAEENQSEFEMEIEPATRSEVTTQNDELSKHKEIKVTKPNGDYGSALFTPIDLRSSFRKGAIGEEVTQYSLDKSWLLNHIFTTAHKSDVSLFLGEYQLAFITMLLSYHLGAFRQWKTMTILVCQSTEAIGSPNYTGLFAEFIKTIHQQLTSIPSSFFMDLLFASPDQDDMTANFLEQALKVLGRNIQSKLRRGECLELRKPMHGLQRAVFESFEWRIPGEFKKVQKIIENEDEDGDDDYVEEGEYAPVIVE